MLREQLLAESFLERAELRADRWRRERQFLGGARETAGAHDSPEVEQVLIVEPINRGHGLSLLVSVMLRENRKKSQDFSN